MNESNENFGSLIPLTFLVILGVTGYVIYNHGLTTDQLISLMRTLTWPFVVILILTNNKTWSLINSITDIEFPGVIKASRKTQQKTEVPEESTQFGDSKNEEVEFKKLDEFLVLNTRNALFWLEKQEGITQEAFLQLHTLIEQIDGDAAKEKLIIFGVLLEQDLIEIRSNKILHVTGKGKRYLQHLGFIPK